MTQFLVPYLINGRVWQWLFVTEESEYRIRLHVRKPVTSTTGVVISRNFGFVKKTRLILGNSNYHSLTETYYECVDHQVEWSIHGGLQLKGTV